MRDNHNRLVARPEGSDSIQAALLEILVHLEFGDPAELPDAYQLLQIDAADAISRITLDAVALPDNWRRQPAATQAAGTRWLAELSSALLLVPNAIVPHTANILINPLHPDAALLRIIAMERYPFDDRLFRRAEAGD